MDLLAETACDDAAAIKLASYIGAEYLKFTNDDVRLMNLFWATAFNESWVYCSKEFVVKYFGYTNTRVTMNHFLRKTIEKFNRRCGLHDCRCQSRTC